MRNLILLFIKYGHFLLFIGLELVCLFLIVRYNRTQRDIWVNSTNIVTGNVSNTFDNWTNYFNMKEEAKRLAEENAKLKGQLFNQQVSSLPTKDTLTLDDQQYFLIPAKISNKSTNEPDNYFTLNKGRKDGIRPDMGVISSNGVIGIVTTASENFSRVITILHRQSAISVSNKKTKAYGTLKWNRGLDYRYTSVEAYPKHAELTVGDTIITSGYSTHFPEGIQVGVVEEFEYPESEYFYKIKVALSNNLNTVKYVYVIENLKQQQQREVEREDE